MALPWLPYSCAAVPVLGHIQLRGHGLPIPVLKSSATDIVQLTLLSETLCLGIRGV